MNRTRWVAIDTGHRETDGNRNENTTGVTTLLQKREEQLALVIEGTGVGLWEWNLQTDKMAFNTSWKQGLGYASAELPSLGADLWRQLVHPGDFENADGLHRKCLNAEIPYYEIEIRLKHQQGHWVWVRERGKVVEWSHDRKALRISGTHLDISERRQAEKSVRDSEQALRTILDNTHDAIIVHSVDGKILDVNQKMLELYQVTREQALAAFVAEDDTPDYPREKLQAYWQRVMDGEDLLFEWNAKRPNDGTIFDVEVALKKITLGDREVVLTNIRDITDRKLARAALREKEEKFRALAENNIDTIMRFDRQHRYLYVNPIVEQQTGIPADEFIGKTHEELGFPKALCSLWTDAIDLVFQGKDVQRIEFQLPNGKWFDWMLMPELDASGQTQAVIASARDITDRKKAEEEKNHLEGQLRQAQKMESVGRLAGGVAHDFNNMLGVIIGQSDLCMETMVPPRPILGVLQEIRKAADRSADLTRQLLAFARKQTIVPRVMDLNATVEGMLNMLRRLIGEHIDLIWLPKDELWRVKMDPSQLDQILANLCVNARDAIGEVGKMTIETGNVTFDESYCQEHIGFAPGDFVMLAVSDNGHGMDSKTQENMFEPFFTTKELGAGSGLGLATVYGIVKQNKGFINVYSEPGQGTTFRIYLPSNKGKASQPENPPAESLVCGNETILLVEDEPAILELTALMLKHHGYTVLAASTPEEAIRLAEAHPGDIHMLMTDVVMPGMNGRELARNLTPLYPNLKHLFMSGYTANVIAHHGVLDEGVSFIQKPFSNYALAAKVREVLDAK